MAPKSAKASAHSNLAPDNYEAAESQFWKSLKGGDIDDLERCLFIVQANDTDGDAEGDNTVAPVKSLNPFASRLVASRNAKKITPLNFVIDSSLEPAHMDALLLAGADINGQDGTKQQRTPLHTACWGEEDVLLDHLLMRGADPSVVNADGSTIFHIAVKSSSAGVLDYLLEMEDEERVSRLHPVKPLAGANKSGAKSLKKPSVMDILQVSDAAGITALHYAVGEISGGHGATEVAQALIAYLEKRYLEKQSSNDDASAVLRNQIKRFVNSQTKAGFNALHMAAVSGVDNAALASIVGRLVSLGCDTASLLDTATIDFEGDVFAESQLEGKQYTALMALCANSKTGLCVQEVLRKLSSDADALSRAVVNGDLTLLHVAVCHSQAALLRDVLFASKSSLIVPVSAITQSAESQRNLAAALAEQLVSADAKDNKKWEAIAAQFVELGYLDNEMIEKARKEAQEALANQNQNTQDDNEDAAENEKGDYAGFGSGTMAGTRRDASAPTMPQRKPKTDTAKGGETAANNAATNASSHDTGRIHKKAPAPQKLSWGAMILLGSFALSFVLPILAWLIPQ